MACKAYVGIGKPGSGQSQVMKRFANQFSMPLIDVDDIYLHVSRAPLNSLSDHEQKLRLCLKRNVTPPDHILPSLVMRRVAAAAHSVPGVVIAGCPRNEDQAHRLIQFFRNRVPAEIIVVLLNPPDELVRKRTASADPRILSYTSPYEAWKVSEFEPRLQSWNTYGRRAFNTLINNHAAHSVILHALGSVEETSAAMFAAIAHAPAARVPVPVPLYA